jgi:hypothetical protein
MWLRPKKKASGADGWCEGIASLTSELHWPVPRRVRRGPQLTEFTYV